MTTTWRADNTEGFTQRELDALNDAQQQLEAEFPDVHESNIADELGNAWTGSARRALRLARQRLSRYDA